MPDIGTTLIEVVAAMSLMSVLLAIFTTGIVSMYRSANHEDATVAAQSQVHLAFQRLDTEIRYAVNISAEGIAPGTGDWYIEYLRTDGGSPVCGQLRLTTGGLLQLRRWSQGAALPPFTTLASGLADSHPFTRKAAGIDGSDYERVVIDLTADGGRDARRRQIEVAFTALNSSPDAADETTCNEGRPT